MNRTVKACISILILLLIAGVVVALLYSQGIFDSLLPDENPDTNTPGGNIDKPGTDTPGGNTDKPGTDTPGGNTDKPGTDTPGGNTDEPGTDTPGGNTDEPDKDEPGETDPEEPTPEEPGETDPEEPDTEQPEPNDPVETTINVTGIRLDTQFVITDNMIEQLYPNYPNGGAELLDFNLNITLVKVMDNVAIQINGESVWENGMWKREVYYFDKPITIDTNSMGEYWDILSQFMTLI